MLMRHLGPLLSPVLLWADEGGGSSQLAQPCGGHYPGGPAEGAVGLQEPSGQQGAGRWGARHWRHRYLPPTGKLLLPILPANICLFGHRASRCSAAVLLLYLRAAITPDGSRMLCLNIVAVPAFLDYY